MESASFTTVEIFFLFLFFHCAHVLPRNAIKKLKKGSKRFMTSWLSDSNGTLIERKAFGV